MCAVGDLPLCPYDPFAHRRLADEERACDLAGAEPADHSQRQSDARWLIESRMATREDQSQPIVGEPAVLGHRLRRVGVDANEVGQALRAVRAGLLATQPIDRLPSRSHRQPAAGVVGYPVSLPACNCRDEGVLQCVFRKLEVAHMPDQRREHAGAILAERALQGRGGSTRGLCASAHAFGPTSWRSTTGRTSTEP